MSNFNYKIVFNVINRIIHIVITGIIILMRMIIIFLLLLMAIITNTIMIIWMMIFMMKIVIITLTIRYFYYCFCYCCLYQIDYDSSSEDIRFNMNRLIGINENLPLNHNAKYTRKFWKLLSRWSWKFNARYSVAWL